MSAVNSPFLKQCLGITDLILSSNSFFDVGLNIRAIELRLDIEMQVGV